MHIPTVCTDSDNGADCVNVGTCKGSLTASIRNVSLIIITCSLWGSAGAGVRSRYTVMTEKIVISTNTSTSHGPYMKQAFILTNCLVQCCLNCLRMHLVPRNYHRRHLQCCQNMQYCQYSHRSQYHLHSDHMHFLPRNYGC